MVYSQQAIEKSMNVEDEEIEECISVSSAILTLIESEITTKHD